MMYLDFFIDIANGDDMIEPLAADPKNYTRLSETLAYLYSLFSKSVWFEEWDDPPSSHS